MVVMEILITASCLYLVTECLAQWCMEIQINYENSIMKYFIPGSSNSLGAMIKSFGRLVHRLVRLFVYCSALCTIRRNFA